MISPCFLLGGFQKLIKIVATKQATAENHCIDLTEVVNVGQRIRDLCDEATLCG